MPRRAVYSGASAGQWAGQSDGQSGGGGGIGLGTKAKGLLRTARSTGWLMVVALAAGCTAGPAARTSTPAPEDVMRTAEAMAEQTRQAASPTPSPTPVTPTPTHTPTVPVTPSVATTPTPVVSGPVVTADYPVSVRSGPGEAYEQVDLFLTGQMARVVGRYDDTPIGTWYLVQRIEVGKDGWVWSGAVTLTGDPGLIPVMTPTA